MLRQICVLICMLSLSGAAYAHLLPKQNATMNVVDEAIFFVVSVPASTLKNVDTDGNGLLSIAEVQAGNLSIRRQFDARFHVSSNGKRGEKVLTWVMPPQTGGETADTDYLVVLHRTNFAKPPKNPRVETDLFGTKAGEAQLVMTATHKVAGVKASETSILETDNPAHTFFRGAWAIFADFVHIGIGHILGGADHLLFLLTIVVVAAGWRYWLCIVTSFTIAHSFTLVISALNVVSISSSVVEIGIAASIVVMAMLNLLTSVAISTKIEWKRIVIIFTCGLLHGLGFAGAVNVFATGSGNQIATLLGFNVGIELGQLLFLGALLLISTVVTRFGWARFAQNLPRFASWCALTLGAILLSVRVAAEL